MDLFKLFPAIFLDIISKVIPGSIFIVVFKNPYLPPGELLLEVLNLKGAVPSDWNGWYSLAVTIATAYLIGILIAIFSYVIDTFLIRRGWYAFVKKNIDDFNFAGKSPPGLGDSLKTSHTFEVYIEYCRGFLSLQNSTTAAMLEKYRTAFRLFVGITIILLLMPFRPEGSGWIYFFTLAPISGWFAVFLSKRYLRKTIQYYLFSNMKAEETSDEKVAKKAID